MKILILSIITLSCACADQRRFPREFEFGAATSAYQIEGAWNVSGRGESVWDHLTHSYSFLVADQKTGDITTDSYHNYKRDVEMMRELGLDSYRFSISWPRILPDGLTTVNEDGIAFYNNYIDEMLKYGIKPMVTLYHWDLPLKLRWLGGFANPNFPEWFESYARIAFENFGDRVKFWTTFNEPSQICIPALSFPEINVAGVYQCAKNIVLANAKAYRLYHDEFRSQGGQCGITIDVQWYEPLQDTEENRQATELVRQYQWGLYAKPIFSQEGGFPKELSEVIATQSAQLGLPSLLLEFTDEEREFVRGTADFFGVNHYTGKVVNITKYEHPSGGIETHIDYSYMPPDWPQSATSWLRQAPHSLFKVLIDLHNKYNGTVFYITENGWSTLPGVMDDDDRIAYHRTALEDVLDCLDAGVNIRGYMVWSLMDSFEWDNGYTTCFGLYAVDFEDPERSRTPKKSAFVYKEVVRSRVVDHNYEPANRTMSIDKGH
ncbi:myrosinase 1-like [Aricia agestis]|uniref:myrosinase 1-like n=1 Tax=Aricia agestis TaxID=91739 RepID=UPI001C20AC21|nr:myrosinase 1-like [Aricia agestis]